MDEQLRALLVVLAAGVMDNIESIWRTLEMTSFDRLAEQQILEHQVRQQRLAELAMSRHSGRDVVEDTSGRIEPDWRQTSVNQAGPMGVLDVVAQDLENFVELFEHAPSCDLTAGSRGRRPGFE
ncbi:hypothetical protein ThidrDRAFT_0310 [Thiorhodococcus drewsii AZ1]|uniref:Uncharacterized protein n=2 Tax=Thiorhodococcus drewsii TaxID=210408 RepID=G2DWC1_9GAMM|nr:hypothetical protein ThidrDRAFT_0310 [Thiorhodococcus drewsii AZ1]